MSYPNLLENEISTTLMNHQEVISKNVNKEKNKTRITYYTIIACISLLSMLLYVWQSPLMKADTAVSKSPETGLRNANSFLNLIINYLIVIITCL